MKIELRQVDYMPADLKPGVLYVSPAFSTAAHLCACGCGSKIRTPLGPTEWSVSETPSGPSLWPSVGNWQKPCRSHYVIDRGEVFWCPAWSPAEAEAGRHIEAARRTAYYRALARQRRPKLWTWVRKLFGR
jgi:hypothetical protein